MKPILPILILLSQITFSQSVKEKEFSTTITDVSVFLTSAQVFESGTITVPTGKTLLKVKELSPYLDDRSIQVKSDADITILSVNHKFNFLKALKKDQKIDSLKKVSESLAEKIAVHVSRLDVLKEKKNLMHENRKIGGTANGATLIQLKQAIDLYDAEFQKIKDEESVLSRSIAEKGEDQKRVTQQLKELNDLKFLPSGEIEILVSADVPTSAKLMVSYLVGNAGWFPKYDVRVKDVKSPLQLTYKAEVHQSTGVEWKNVKLKFSNGDPKQSGVIPELNTWNLNYARYTRFDKSSYGLALGADRNVTGVVLSQEDGTPLPGVNVVAKGTTVGTVTDSNGNFSITAPNDAGTLVFSFIGMQTVEQPVSAQMSVHLTEDVTQLTEVVVTGTAYGMSEGGALFGGRDSNIRIRGASSLYGSRSASNIVTTTFIENQTTVEIAVETPYTIRSNGEKLLVDLVKYDVAANYQYYAIPKLDKDAFLVAQIIQWDQYNLLEGEANLYFEDGYVGRTVLDAKALKDTLTISLGRDKNIVVGRTKTAFSKQRTIGGNRIEARGFNTIVRNKKSQPIKLKIFDHVPVSVMNDITVSIAELSGGILDEKTGKVNWDLVVDPQQQKEVLLQYEVRFPKREKVILE